MAVDSGKTKNLKIWQIAIFRFIHRTTSLIHSKVTANTES